jgi:hypothetical protein
VLRRSEGALLEAAVMEALRRGGHHHALRCVGLSARVCRRFKGDRVNKALRKGERIADSPGVVSWLKRQDVP